MKRKWWFTILAPEVTLSIIDTNWHLLSARSSWSLQHSLQTSGHPPAFKSPVQKHVNKGSGSVVSSGDLQGSVQVDKDRVSNVSAVRHQGSVQGNIGSSVFTTSQQDSDHVSLPMDVVLPVSSGFPEASTGSFSDFYISSHSYSANGTSPDSMLQSSASCSSSNIVLASRSLWLFFFREYFSLSGGSSCHGEPPGEALSYQALSSTRIASTSRSSSSSASSDFAWQGFRLSF